MTARIGSCPTRQTTGESRHLGRLASCPVVVSSSLNSITRSILYQVGYRKTRHSTPREETRTGTCWSASRSAGSSVAPGFASLTSPSIRSVSIGTNALLFLASRESPYRKVPGNLSVDGNPLFFRYFTTVPFVNSGEIHKHVFDREISADAFPSLSRQ